VKEPDYLLKMWIPRPYTISVPAWRLMLSRARALRVRAMYQMLYLGAHVSRWLHVRDAGVTVNRSNPTIRYFRFVVKNHHDRDRLWLEPRVARLGQAQDTVRPWPPAEYSWCPVL